MNVGNKTWQTGVFGRKLKTISAGKDKRIRGDKDAINRAKIILAKRDEGSGAPRPAKGIGFFPFEEDLIHHIGESLSICSTGISCNFFSSPYVKDFLGRLEPRHRVIYRLKMVRIVRCINDTLTNEVNASRYSFLRANAMITNPVLLFLFGFDSD